jgi:hypothetical protein
MELRLELKFATIFRLLLSLLDFLFVTHCFHCYHKLEDLKKIHINIIDHCLITQFMKVNHEYNSTRFQIQTRFLDYHKTLINIKTFYQWNGIRMK